MRKIAALLIAAVMALGLCACDSINDDEPKSPVPAFDLTLSYAFDTAEADEASGLYFSKSIGTVTVSSSDERAAGRINDSLTSVYGGFTESAALTEKVAADQDGSEEPQLLSYTVTPDAPRCDMRALSLTFDTAQDLGGIHAEVRRISRSYDADSGKLLTLDDISGEPEKLRTFIKNYVIGLAAGEEYKENGESVLFPEANETIGSLVDEGANWYFSDEGLVFYANPYDIAPYSRGVLDFVLPYSVLEDFISPSFMPVDYEGENGMLLADNGDETDRDAIALTGSVTLDEGGQSVILSAEETVYDVRLYSARGTLWQRNYLTTGEGVELISFIPDVSPSVAVSYRLADGSEVVRGIFQSGKDGSIILVELGEDELSRTA